MTDAGKITKTAFAMLGEYLDVSQFHYAQIDTTSGTFFISHEWTSDDTPVIADKRGELADLSPDVIAALQTGEFIAVSDACNKSAMGSTPVANSNVNIRSHLTVPIIKEGRLAATLNLHQGVPRHWTPQQISLIENVADRIWNAVTQAHAVEQKNKAEQALMVQREAETERLRSLFQQAPGFMCILRGADHVFEFANTAYQQLVGDRVLLGLPVSEALPEVIEQGFLELLNQVFTTATPFIASDIPFLVQLEHGGVPVQRYVDFVYQPIVDLDGTVSGIFVEGFDVTEQHLAKVALVESRDRLNEGMLAASMVTWDRELATDKITFSDNVAAVLGANWTSIEDIWQSIHPDDLPQLQATHDDAILRRDAYKTVIRFIRPDNGHQIWLQIHGKVTCDDQNVPVKIKGVSLDITERKLMEEKLRDVDRSKDAFFAMLSHELRNPLSPIANAIVMIRKLNTGTRLIILRRSFSGR